MLGMWTFFIALLLCLLLLSFWKELQTWRCYPPGPLPLPVIGSLWRFMTSRNQDIFIEMAKQYGDVFTIWRRNKPIVILSGYQAVKEALINHAQDFSDRPLTPLVKSVFKERGITFANGRTWKQHRRFSQVTMQKLGVGKKELQPRIEQEAQQLVEILACANGHPVDPSFPICNSVSNVVTSLAFGHRFSIEDEEYKKLLEVNEDYLRFAVSATLVLYEMFPWLMKHLPGLHKRTLSGIERAVVFSRKQVAQHKECPSLHKPQDFTDFYLLQMEKPQNKNDPKSSTFDEDNLVQCLIEFFAAGTDTTAATLQWALLLMSTRPDIQDKVQKEMDDVFGSSQSIYYHDRKKLPYTNAVIHEMQRYNYVQFFGVPRQCVNDVNILGHFIPKGTTIFPDLRSVLFDPKLWETPEEFNPNHFLDKEGYFVDRKDFLLFGAGSRVCSWKKLAEMEVFILFTSLLRAFTFQLPDGVKEVNLEPVVWLIMHPHPYEICCIPRCSASSTI